MGLETVSACAVPLPTRGGCRLCLWPPGLFGDCSPAAPGEMGTDLLLKRPSGAASVPRTVAVLRRPWLRLDAREVGLLCRPQDPLWRAALAASPEARVNLSGAAEFRAPCDAETAMRAHLGGVPEEWAIRLAGGVTIAAHFAIARMEPLSAPADAEVYRFELACEASITLKP